MLLLTWPKQLEECAKRRPVKFKCEVLHLGQNSPYVTADWELTDWEKDLGVLVDKTLYRSQQCFLAVMKAKLHCHKHNQQVKTRDNSPLLLWDSVSSFCPVVTKWIKSSKGPLR